MQRNYELLVILNYDSIEEDIVKLTDKITEIITKEGGEVKKVNRWGKRRLAYEINKSKKGFYLLIQFSGEPVIVQAIRQDIKFVEGIERFMTVVVSEKSASSLSETDLEIAEEAIL